MTKQYDAVIIGAGHNGLIAAAYLARAGKKVLVLERRHLVGGATVTEEIFPGFKYSVLSYVVSLLRPEIVRELKLAEHGLTILPLESTLTPLYGGDYLVRWADYDQTRRELYRHSPHDADASTAPAKRGEKPTFFISGIVITPVVTVLAIGEPEIMPNRPDDTTLTLAGPPAKRPAAMVARLTNNCPNPVSCAMMPNSTKWKTKVATTPTGMP